MEDTQKASLEKLVKKICTQENIVNAKVNYVTGGPKNGYLSSIVKIEISGDGKKLYLIGKYASAEEGFRENLKVRTLYLQEMKFYTEVMPLYKKLQESFRAKHPFSSTAKCYGIDDAPKCELLVLEDLIHSGYILKNSLVPMDSAHTEFILKEYGKYHATSLAYKHHDYEGYQKLMQETTSIFQKFLGTKGSEISVQALNNLKEWLDPKEPMFEAYSKVCEDTNGFQERNSATDEYAVLCHGDSWCNNFMFKYENNSEQPTSVKFIDFQIMSPGSLVLDISYFLMTNSSPEMVKNIDHFLKVYYDALAKHLRELNCDPEVVFPCSIFKDQWKKYSVHGLISAITVLKFAIVEQDEKPDLSNNLDNAVNYVGKHDGEYRSRTEAVIRYYYEAGIIQ